VASDRQDRSAPSLNRDHDQFSVCLSLLTCTKPSRHTPVTIPKHLKHLYSRMRVGLRDECVCAPVDWRNGLHSFEGADIDIAGCVHNCVIRLYFCNYTVTAADRGTRLLPDAKSVTRWVLPLLAFLSDASTSTFKQHNNIALSLMLSRCVRMWFEHTILNLAASAPRTLRDYSSSVWTTS
jgi:hypothetical protein